MKIDITRNAVWTEDCGGKMDLDFPVLDCDTRYWTDNTCKCHLQKQGSGITSMLFMLLSWQY